MEEESRLSTHTLDLQKTETYTICGFDQLELLASLEHFQQKRFLNPKIPRQGWVEDWEG